MNHNSLGAPCLCSCSVETVSRTLHAMCGPANPANTPAGLGTSLPVGIIKHPKTGLSNNQTPSPMHIKAPSVVKRHCEQQINRDRKVLSPDTTFIPSHSTRSGLTAPKRATRRLHTKLDFGPKISGVREKSLPASSVICASTIIDCSHRFSRTRRGGGQPAIDASAWVLAVPGKRHQLPAWAALGNHNNCLDLEQHLDHDAVLRGRAPNLTTGTPQEDRQIYLQALRPNSAI